MGKNKTVISGFTCFMDDFEKTQGRKFGSKKDLADAAGPHWNNLSEKQREKYRNKAKALKNDSAKYCSKGIKIDVITEELSKIELSKHKMKTEIQSLINVLKESQDVANHMFYILSVNDFCFCNTTKEYIPAEIAVARFNLLDGVVDDNIFHFIVKPGKLPLGYTAEASRVSKETHQLSVPFCIDGSEDNREEVIESLLRFMRVGISGIDKEFPPLYCDSKKFEKATNIIKTLLTKYGYGEDLIKVYDLEFLFFNLRNAADPKGDTWRFISLSALELEKDTYDYCPGIACDFHDETEVPNYCVRSIVIRQVYMICKNCCPDLGIQLVPGHHIPFKAFTVNLSIVNEDTSSVKSERREYVRRRPDYLASGTESVMSFETAYTSQFEDYKDTESEDDYNLSQNSNTADWVPVTSRRHNKNYANFENSDPVTHVSDLSQTQSETLSFNSAATASGSNNSQKRRRPQIASAALGPSCSVPISRGRGRGIEIKMKSKPGM